MDFSILLLIYSWLFLAHRGDIAFITIKRAIEKRNHESIFKTDTNVLLYKQICLEYLYTIPYPGG
jgi:hypothetical protein